MKKYRLATIGAILILLATACERTTVVDTSPVGNGLAVIGIVLLLFLIIRHLGTRRR